MVRISKKLNCIMISILLLASYFIGFAKVNAETVRIGTILEATKVRTGPGQSHSQIDTLYKDQTVTILGESPKGDGCSYAWLNVQYGNTKGYMCSTTIKITTTEVDTSFPSSYQAAISALKAKHPNWSFKALQTGLDWNAALNVESTVGSALVDGSDVSLRSKDPAAYDASTNTYKQFEPGWYAASRNTVAYYMDPRNFLTEQYIFMFEDLNYKRDIHTSNVVTKILGNTYMSGLYSNYANTLMSAANNYNISPVHLASRIRQETGVRGSVATSGAPFVYEYDPKTNQGNNQTYSGIYNFFNIGAYNYKSPAIRGLIWANGGTDGSVTTYQRPWRTPEKALLGGSQYLSDGYISKGQNTAYFQRFNVSPFSAYPKYTHQYMTNIRAHSSEATTTYNSYKSLGLLNEALEFVIPIYENMPGENTKPTEPDPTPNPGPNPSVSLDTIMGNLGVRYDSDTMSGIALGKTADSLVADVRGISSSVSVSVTNANGNGKSGALGTGDKLILKSGSENRTYSIIIYGDTNGDGKINISDLLRTQKIILGSTNVSGVYWNAADNNRDGKITIVDLLRVQKHILGSIRIN